MGKRKLTKEPDHESLHSNSGDEEVVPDVPNVSASHSFLESLNTDIHDVNFGRYREEGTDAGEECYDENEGNAENEVEEEHEVEEENEGDDEWEPEEDDEWDDEHDIEDLDNIAQYYGDEEEGDVDQYSDDEDDEAVDTDDVNVNFNELILDDQAQHAVKNKRNKKIERIEYSNRLPEEFKLLMGEANLCVAKGNRKTAINICLEIIRNVPDSPAPYETLSVIYEEENDLYKSVQYGLISAHLWPQDPHKWYGLAQKCIELNDKENSKICMSKALRYSHLTRDKSFIEDVIRYFVRADVTDETLPEEDAQKLAVGYRKLIKISSSSDTDDLRDMLQVFENKCGDIRKQELWAKTYIALISAYPDQAHVEKISKICKVYLALKYYNRVAGLLVQTGYVRVDKPEVLGTERGTEILGPELDAAVKDRVDEMTEGRVTAAPTFDRKYTVVVEEEDCPARLRAALVASLIYRDHDNYNTEELLSPLLTLMDPNIIGEELLLVADSYFNTNNYPAALPIYELLANSCHVEHSHTWVQLGHCHEEKGDWREAVKCYETVLSFEDSNATAKLRLFSLQQDHLAENREQFSVNIHADPTKIKELSGRPDVVKLSFHQTNDLITAGQYEEALEEGYSVLKSALLESIEQQKSSSAKHSTGEYIRGQFTSTSAFNMLEHLVKAKLGQNKGECEAYRDMLSREQWYDWYIGMLSCCMGTNKLNQAFLISLGALCSRLIDYQPAIKNISIHCIYLAGVLNYSDYISENIGPLLYSNPDTPGIWNIFYMIRHRLPQYRLHRLGVRWLFKNRNAFNGLFLNSQNSYYSRHYKAALAFFRQMLGQRPRDGKVYFYLSLFYLHYSCSKTLEFAQRRHEMVVQGVACIFMYHQLRGSCQETLFNIGRCYHHLGLFHYAIQYYKKVLLTPPSVPDEVQQQLDAENNQLSAQKSDNAAKNSAKNCTDESNKAERTVAVELDDIDLTHEAVYNMCQIYSAGGSEHLARQLLYQYAVV